MTNILNICFSLTGKESRKTRIKEGFMQISKLETFCALLKEQAGKIEALAATPAA